MKSIRSFDTQDTMSDLIRQDFNILPVISRFSIPLGVGNRNIGEVCAQAGVNTHVFLLVVNFLLTGKMDMQQVNVGDVSRIVDFLHNSHTYFLDYKFPHIRKNLESSLDPTHVDINPAIMKFYDDFVAQVKLHFAYEESTVFPYIRSLLKGEHSSYNISIFRQHHDEVAVKLTELKNIILLYYTTTKPDQMYDALVDIFNCEEDLESHSDIENNILIPAIQKVEQEKKTKYGKSKRT